MQIEKNENEQVTSAAESPNSTEPLQGPAEYIAQTHKLLENFMMARGVNREDLQNGDIRLPTVLYMVYWHLRLRNNTDEQRRIYENLVGYMGTSVPSAAEFARQLFDSEQVATAATVYAENLLLPTPTVDLVFMRGDGQDSSVLCQKRDYYPQGLALPGGIIQDTDEDNTLDLSPQIYAALRVAAQKVLGIDKDINVKFVQDSESADYYEVCGSSPLPKIKIFTQDAVGYVYKENVRTSLRPADPRHIVDTVGYRCEIEGEASEAFEWRTKKQIMSPSEPTGGFAFGHHREIVAHITAQTSVQKERQLKEHDFVTNLIKDPYGSYIELEKRFAEREHSPLVSMPEIFPCVDSLLTQMFEVHINVMCEATPLLAGVRDKAVIALRQVSLKNRTFCPYVPTLNAIAQAMAFFDIVARQKRDFYTSIKQDSIIEHNPAHTKYAQYHMYRYKYRLDELMTMVPHQIIVPTFENLSATALMRVRGTPIRFLGLSTDFLYVDEFDQSPEEFYMHDANHTWRMVQEDKKAMQELGLTPDEFYKKSTEFATSYLEKIKIRKTDSEEERELKKLKKIILFEIVHEDARPFLQETICKYIQQKEGAPVPFEVPRIDPSTGYMDMVDTLDTGIATLAYVRNKLQHGFYDQVDAQLPQIVSPHYRTAHWITVAARQMLVELGAAPGDGVPFDDDGHVAFDWLLRRTCSAGPDNAHAASSTDPDVERYGDGVAKLNPKRYQANKSRP